jgi:hydrogenase expression/formation protein HypC
MCLGIPGRVVAIRENGGFPMGVVDFGGVRRDVCLAYVAREVAVDDFVIVHVGFAISKVDEAEAKRTFEVLREMSRLDELEWIADAVEPESAFVDAASRMPGGPP